MSPAARRRSAAATLAVGLMAGCSSSPPSPATPSSSPTSGPAASSSAVVATSSPAPAGAVPAALQRFYRQHLTWSSCGSGFQCSTLTVPVDYAHPTAGTLGVAVIRKRASGHSSGSLVINPGGPGGSGVQFLRESASSFPDVNSSLDLVSFDPRGVGQSRPIRCVTSAQLDAFEHVDPDPPTSAGFATLVRSERQFALDCFRRNGSYLSHVATIDAARDMDVLRAALGDPKLTYYGASYGTFLGAEYASLFPTRIRALVLDGAVNPAESDLQGDIVQAGGFQTDLEDYLAACVAKGNCPLGSSVSAATTRINQLFAQVRRQPLVVGSRSVGPAELFNGIAQAMYTTQLWSALTEGFTRALKGDGTYMLLLSDLLTERNADGSYSNLVESNVAINCVDRQTPSSLATFTSAAASARRTSPFFGAAIVYSSLACAYWKVPPVTTSAPIVVTGAPPIVVIGTTHDPATPYSDAVALASQLHGSVLVTLKGDGHTAYLFRSNSCIVNAVNRYLLDRIVPAKGLTCS